MSDLMKRMRERFPEVGTEDVDELVVSLHHQFDGRPIRDFVPVLVERDAVTRLRQAARPRANAPG